MDVEVELVNFSQYHINVCVAHEEKKTPWILIGFYNNPKTSKRQEYWSLLSTLKQITIQAQCVIENFNKISIQDESWEVNQELKG